LTLPPKKGEKHVSEMCDMFENVVLTRGAGKKLFSILTTQQLSKYFKFPKQFQQNNI
jgi:hypothetical protein